MLIDWPRTLKVSLLQYNNVDNISYWWKKKDQRRLDFFLHLWGAFPHADGTWGWSADHKQYSHHNNGSWVIDFFGGETIDAPRALSVARQLGQLSMCIVACTFRYERNIRMKLLVLDWFKRERKTTRSFRVGCWGAMYTPCATTSGSAMLIQQSEDDIFSIKATIEQPRIMPLVIARIFQGYASWVCQKPWRENHWVLNIC